MDQDMETVRFTQMKDGTREDYELIRRNEHRYFAGTARRVLDELARQGDETIEGYKITRLEHALQSATRAEADGADADWIVTALLHDIGDALAPQNHDRMAEAILKPFVREECSWVAGNHGVFQMVYYAQHYDGWNQYERETHRGHRYFDRAVEFCEFWDQSSFDPEYPSKSLGHFAPMVAAVFSRDAHAADVIRAGETTPIRHG